MSELQYITKGNASPKDKPKVFFTCHPKDFERYFEEICEDIFKTYDCAIFYTEDMSVRLDDENRDLDLYQMNLFVMPVTFRLLTEPNRAMDEDYAFADENHIPVLPLMMESNIDEFYTRRFGERQYISVFEHDPTKKSYSEQLRSYLRTVFLDKETVERIRKAFDVYIFLSYRKKDRRYANELMQMIHSHPELEKIAIWYDEFLTPGESFMENIRKILTDSKLFSLLVTPSLLEKPNFVMEHEYPAAKESDKPILPAQAVVTDSEQLKKDYANIPSVIDIHNEAVFEEKYLNMLRQYAVKENRDDPEHNYLIGLAYLDGIDVEVDKERGVKLITFAAEAEWTEAMEKLCDMYYDGYGVAINYDIAQKWAQQLYDINCSLLGKNHPDTLSSLNNLVVLTLETGDYTKSLRLAEKSLSLNSKAFGEKHPNTLLALNNLACAYYYLGEKEKALEVSVKSYNYHKDTLGEKDHETLTILSNLVILYFENHDNNSALKYSEKNYFLCREVLGERHKETIIALNYFAISRFMNMKSYKEGAEALDLLKKSYSIAKKNLGLSHPRTIDIMKSIAYCDSIIGNYYSAIIILENAYQNSCIVRNKNHPYHLDLLD